jgi:hypothetical protein
MSIHFAFFTRQPYTQTIAKTLNLCPFVGRSSTCYTKNLRKSSEKFEKIFLQNFFKLSWAISHSSPDSPKTNDGSLESPDAQLHFDTKLAYTISAESEFAGGLRKWTENPPSVFLIYRCKNKPNSYQCLLLGSRDFATVRPCRTREMGREMKLSSKIPYPFTT